MKGEGFLISDASSLQMAQKGMEFDENDPDAAARRAELQAQRARFRTLLCEGETGDDIVSVS